MTYSQFCPIAKASEIICEKWALIVLRELFVGTDTFNGLRNYIPLISPSMLSKRLQEFEDNGILNKIETNLAKPKYRYQLTQAGKELGPVLLGIGDWGNRWAVSTLKEGDYDPRLLMWDIKRNINVAALGLTSRYVAQFSCTGVPAEFSRWWFVLEPDAVPDICFKNPGYDVALRVSSDIKTFVNTWMGWEPLKKAIDSKQIELVGAPEDIRRFPEWYTLSLFANRPSQ